MTTNPDAVWANRPVKAILLIRILVGWVFLSEGIQKFLFPDALGVGRFVKIGIPWPQVMAPFVRVVEIVFGILRLLDSISHSCGTLSGLLHCKVCTVPGRRDIRQFP